METFTYISRNTQDTINFAKKLASKLQKKDIIVLNGDLGSGKTKFTEGLLSFFNLENEISSPTFTIVNEYDAPICPIYHFDVYRLESSDEFLEFGGEEYFTKGISVIEWGNIIKSVLPSNYLEINFTKDNDDLDIRYLNITAHGNFSVIL